MPQGPAIVPLPIAQPVAHLFTYFIFCLFGEKVAQPPLLCLGYTLGLGEGHGAYS